MKLITTYSLDQLVLSRINGVCVHRLGSSPLVGVLIKWLDSSL